MNLSKNRFLITVILLISIALSPLLLASQHLSPDESVFVDWHQQPDGSYRFTLKNRIIGGTTVSQGTYPWMVALVDNNYANFCGGSLIASNWVLTAAHCVEGQGNINPQLNVIINRATLSSSEGEVIAVEEVIIHPNYTSADTGYDVALLRLRSESSQTPITLVNSNEGDLSGSLATVIGWGNRSTDGYDFPDVLHQVNVPVVSNAVCNSSYGIITDNMLCAGVPEGGIDSCQGDSGGPLVVFSNNTWTQIGIVSWGSGCAQPNYYGVYARVTELVTWINSNINSSTTTQLPSSLDLTSGNSVSDTVNAAEWDNFKISSSASDTKLTVTLSNLSDNADLYLRKDNSPTLFAYDCISNKTGTQDETCEVDISGQSAATWYIAIYGNASGNVSYNLTATLSSETTQTTTPNADTLTSGQAVSGSVTSSSWVNYSIDSTNSDTKLVVTLSNLSEDADLYINKDGLPTTTSYDCASYEYGTSNERCEIDISAQGAATWYISVYGYAKTDVSYTLTATLSEEEITTSQTTSENSLSSAQAVSGTVSTANWVDYTISASGSEAKLTARLSNLNDDADLYIKKEGLPTTTDYDCASYEFGSADELCEVDISGQAAATWYVSVYGYADQNVSYTLTATLSGTASTSTSSSREQIEQYVTRFYEQTLLRSPDSSGLSYWSDNLENGTLTGADVAYNFVFSTEFNARQVSDQEYVTILYRAFFNREPDQGGYDGWIAHLSSGQSRAFVLNGFLSATEFYNLCNDYNITCN